MRKDSVRIARKTAVGMDELVREYIREMKLSSGLNTQRIFAAWDDASGAARFTVRRFYRDGRLYITLNSSVVRNQLSFQRQALTDRMNAILRQDELFTRDDARVSFIQELILK